MSRSQRLALLLGAMFFVAGLVAFGLGHDWCAGRRPGAPRVGMHAGGVGPLRAGAATSPLGVPLPATLAGYGVPRATTSTVAFPVEARALVVESGGVRVGLVTLDLLVGDAALDRAIRGAVAGLGLTDLWVTVTHTHSGPGGYAENPIAQVAGTGRLSTDTRAAVVAAAARALTEANRSLVEVTLRLGETAVPELVGAREPPQDVDARLSRLVLDAPSGSVAQLVVFGCHPTLVPRPASGLDPDWPGRLAALERERGHGVTLVLQGAVGNVSIALREPGGERLAHFVSSLASALDGVSLTPAPAGLAVARATVDLPGPDASRIVPRLVRPLTDNVFCAASPATADVSLLRLGPLVLLGVPGEPTAAAARVLEAAAGAGRVVSLVNGYLGYAETPAHLATGEGEAERQLLRPEFLEVLAEGGRKARSALP